MSIFTSMLRYIVGKSCYIVTERFSPKRPTRSNSVNPTMMLGHTTSVTSKRPARKSVLNTIPDLPVSDEVINSISSFCFPGMLKVFTHIIVLFALYFIYGCFNHMFFLNCACIQNFQMWNVFAHFVRSFSLLYFLSMPVLPL